MPNSTPAARSMSRRIALEEARIRVTANLVDKDARSRSANMGRGSTTALSACRGKVSGHLSTGMELVPSL